MFDDEFIPEPEEQPKEHKTHNVHQAIVAYIPFLCFISLFGKESDEFTKAHGRQGLILLVLELIAVTMLIVGPFFWKMILVVCLIASLAGIVYAFTGRLFTLPFVGKWADRV